ncbi:porin family protein [Hymenobacter terrenus]|uniref:porin family protein n=1 Tax=Hymenobacter terrenus TaxID=1629124 RepID=UPI000698AE9A|nr:porin family protein [Hymenobacter terrenus]
MKKALLSLLLFAGLHRAAHAQRSDVSLGLKAGASLTNFVGKDAPNSDYRFGFHAGVFANVGLTKLVAFQPELLYSQKGDVSELNEEFKTRLHYIDVPLAFHLNRDGLFFEAGPQVGFLIAARYEAGSLSADTKDLYKTVDFGYLAGLGYQLKQGIGLGLRYNGEFTEFPKSINITGNLKQQTRARNSAFQLYATYSFN